MSTTMKVLRDAKLTDGTLVRWMNGDNVIILSTITPIQEQGFKSCNADNPYSSAVLPDTVEAAMELLNMANMMLRRNLQREMGQVKVS